MCQLDKRIESIQLLIQGQIQGVGFRPFIYRLATELSLTGFVRNTDRGVEVVISGAAPHLTKFQLELKSKLPSSARIDHIERNSIERKEADTSFRIVESSANRQEKEITEVSPDLAVCSECVKELFTPGNPRYLHPFITCTQCGPRYSVISALPYDREHTSMDCYTMCQTCIDEYQSPENRRFHSQTNACNECGPTLSLHGKQGALLKNESSQALIDYCANQIHQGNIIAMKGIGGFHLICDANNPESIERLRELKARPEKPFAVMALNPLSLSKLVTLDSESSRDLTSNCAPIVLLPKRIKDDKHIAPNLDSLGCCLPYTALHYLLFHSLLGKPSGMEWLSEEQELKLVVTSANLPGEPILYENSRCLEQISNLADCALVHDREIHAPCDDSVLQPGNPKIVVRRARGYVPASIPVTKELPNGLAYGAHLKNTFCLVQQNKAYLSPYIGELNNPARVKRFQSTLSHFEHLFGRKIERCIADSHPDYVSTYLAEKDSNKRKLPLSLILHHHAHLASVVAEQSKQHFPALGLSLDGHGRGENGESWGGELFYLDDSSITRIGHLEEIELPGGDIAVKEIWRLGARLLARAGLNDALKRYHKTLSQPLTREFIIERDHLLTSSAGRWFDAIASIIGLRQECSYEGQAAAELEAKAKRSTAKSLLKIDSENRLIISPILGDLIETKSQSQASSLFHIEFIDGLVRWVVKAAKKHKTFTLYCSGGCFQNRLLRESLCEDLTAQGFRVFFNEKVPINDGGISFGQAYLANDNQQGN